jgi:hypothetical protein
MAIRRKARGGKEMKRTAKLKGAGRKKLATTRSAAVSRTATEAVGENQQLAST